MNMLIERCNDIWYRIKGRVCWCGVRELVCVTVDAIASAIGGEPVEFGGHCDVVDVCGMCVYVCAKLLVCSGSRLIVQSVSCRGVSVHASRWYLLIDNA